MISKSEVKYIQSLSHKKNRDAEGVFIAETPKLVNELLQSGIRIKKIYATNEWQQQSKADIEVETIDEIMLQRISLLETPNKVLAIAEKKQLPQPELKKQFTLALDGIQDPGNLGTIVRIADWFGITQIIAARDSADCYSPKAVQSSMGSIARVNVWYQELVPILANAGVPVYGALLQGESVYNIGHQHKEAILVIGNEAKGIREAILSYIQYPVTIPRIGAAESLNAAVATGILLSHFVQS